MKIYNILNQEIKNDRTKHLIVENLLDDKNKSDLIEIINESLEDEDFENGVISKFLPKALLNIFAAQSKVFEFLLELVSEEIQKSLLEKINVNVLENQKITSRLNFEIISPDTQTEKKSKIGGYKDAITLKIFLCESDNFLLQLNDKNINVPSNSLILFEDSYQTLSKVLNNSDKNLYLVTLSIKTEIVNPSIIHNQSNSNVGVIIDCKDMESPSDYKGLEYSLANFTRYNLIKNNFTNIVCFIDREDFDKSVKLLKSQNVKKILVLFAGATVGPDTFDKVKTAQHITAWKHDNRVFRKYIIFDTEKYNYFQIRGEFLSNVLDEIDSKIHSEFDISSLQPDENTYKFLEKIHDGIFPDISLLENASIGDQAEGEIIIERMKEIMLNTV